MTGQTYLPVIDGKLTLQRDCIIYKVMQNIYVYRMPVPLKVQTIDSRCITLVQTSLTPESSRPVSEIPKEAMAGDALAALRQIHDWYTSGAFGLAPKSYPELRSYAGLRLDEQMEHLGFPSLKERTKARMHPTLGQLSERI